MGMLHASARCTDSGPDQVLTGVIARLAADHRRDGVQSDPVALGERDA